MYPIDTSSASPTQPTLLPSGPTGYYTAGNMGLSIPPTTIGQDALNIVQDELDNVVIMSGGTLAKADQTQVWQAIGRMIAAATRKRLTANTTFYVSTSGNDTTGNGSSGAPWATINNAATQVQNLYDLNGYDIVFSCSGDFTGGAGLGFPFVGQANVGSVVFDGGGSAQINVTNGNCFYSDGASFTVRNFGLLSVGGTAGFGNGNIFGVNQGTLQFNNCNFGNAVGSHLVSFGAGANIIAIGNYTISGGASLGHIAAETLGCVRSDNASHTVTVSGTPNFPIGFVSASGGGVVNYGEMVISGGATGSRYALSIGGIIATNGGGPNFFPGDSAGTNDGTGVYS